MNLGPFFCLLMVHKGKVEEKAYKKGSKGHVCGTVRISPFVSCDIDTLCVRALNFQTAITNAR